MPNDSSQPAGAERRRFPRYPFVAYAEVTDLRPPHVRIKARTSDLGREGCYMDTITPFEAGTHVLIQIMKNEKSFSARGLVLCPTLAMGMAVHFTSIQPAEVPVIVRWIMELSGEVPADVPEPEIQDHSELNEARELLA